jgi:hypothetical protein
LWSIVPWAPSAEIILFSEMLKLSKIKKICERKMKNLWESDGNIPFGRMESSK